MWIIQYDEYAVNSDVDRMIQRLFIYQAMSSKRTITRGLMSGDLGKFIYHISRMGLMVVLIQDVNYGSDESMPPYVAPGQVETAEDDNDDLLVSQGRRLMRHPLTGTCLEDPVTR